MTYVIFRTLLHILRCVPGQLSCLLLEASSSMRRQFILWKPQVP